MPQIDDLIQIRDFTYRYPPVREGDQPTTALDGITLAVPGGQFVGVTGTTGSGKSTLCLALCGIVPHATGGVIRGDITIGDWNTKQTPVPQMATRVGLVFQDPESNLVGLAVEDEVAFGPENLGLPPAEIAERVGWALDVVGMGDARQRSSAQLSGGQKQRVAIAAVLAMRPEILVLDEPTAQLDPQGKIDVASAIAALREQHGTAMTVIMVESDTELLARFADRVVVLDAGTVVLDGSPREIFSRVEELHRIGVDAPQIAEVSDRLRQQLGRDLDFYEQEAAAQVLSRLLEGQRQP